MRKIIGSLFHSLDGVIQAPGGPEEDQTGFAHGGWIQKAGPKSPFSLRLPTRMTLNSSAC